MSSATADRPKLDPTKFSASLMETPGLAHNLTVSGEAVGDYRKAVQPWEPVSTESDLPHLRCKVSRLLRNRIP